MKHEAQKTDKQAQAQARKLNRNRKIIYTHTHGKMNFNENLIDIPNYFPMLLRDMMQQGQWNARTVNHNHNPI
jgi:hypothetical protein